MRLREVLFLMAATALAGCAKDIVEFEKPGVARAAMLRDQDVCWAQARKSAGQVTDAQKAGNVAQGALSMGVVGIVGAAALNANADDPYSSRYLAGRNACMRAKGYTVGWAKSE